MNLAGQDIVVIGGGLVSSGTAGAGDGGTVQVAARGSLSLREAGSGIKANGAELPESMFEPTQQPAMEELY